MLRSAAAVLALLLLVAQAHGFTSRASQDAPPQSRAEPLTWETLEDRLQEEADAGFTGVVLVVRDGETVIEDGFGLANREEEIPNTPETIFAIGSTPIDFTAVGILLLEQRDRLSLSDPITKYFDNVPADKQSITIEHLMTGQSGLQNFHDIPTDRDPDHSWISRDEAVSRIFAQELLFAPGEGREHSHSAWGVLAAILEIVSEQSYQDFMRETFFVPLEMNDTGFHGDAIPESRMAVGYGMKQDGTINAPPYWGKTSWLVMGSGGQISTARDMARWIDAIHARRFLNEENTQRFLRYSRGLLNGGNSYGFEIYYTYSPRTYMVLLANAVNRSNRQAVDSLAREIGDLVLNESRPPFTLGVGLEIRDDGTVISQVVPDSGADRAGLQPGDVIITVDGQPLGDDPLSRLESYLTTGKPVPFEIQRNGDRLHVTVTPTRRE